MRALFKSIQAVVALSLLTLVVSCAPGVSAGCTLHDLGHFTICTPPTWALVKGGTDSAAGYFQDGALRVSYDFGLNSDPLAVPAGATGAVDGAITVDGHPARQVGYKRTAATTTFYLGVHVPEVARVSMGRIKLTLLASTSNSDQLRLAESAFATVRFKSAAR